MNTEEVVQKYVQLRDAKASYVKRFKDKVEKVDEAMSKLEAVLLQQLEATGADSIKTKSGTAFKTRKTSATVSDWDAVLNYVLDNKLFNLLEKRVSKNAVVEFKEANNDLPPGVSWREELAIGVRRS
jgi:hypothetical protein